MRRLLLILILLCFALPIQAQVFTLIEILLNSASTEEPEFTIFLFVLSQSDDTLIDDFGRTDDEWTIFAPSDEAFRTFMKSNHLRLRDLMDDEACVFMGRDELGITFCGIEKSYNDKKIDFKKPISCHLYPIRITKNEKTGFEALNYDTWDICNPACSHGEKNKIRVFEFVKDALVRKYGLAFYDELSAAADHLNNS